MIERERRDGKEIVWKVEGNSITSTDDQYKKTFGKMIRSASHERAIASRKIVHVRLHSLSHS